MLKKFLSLALAVLMTLSLCSCDFRSLFGGEQTSSDNVKDDPIVGDGSSYSEFINVMQISAAQKIDKGIGKVDTTIREDAVPTPQKRERTMTDFKPKQGKIRKSGTGGIYQISENLWEGRFTPTNAQGKREAHNVYAKTREECERLLDEMIVEVRQQIQAEKEQMKGMSL